MGLTFEHRHLGGSLSVDVVDVAQRDVVDDHVVLSDETHHCLQSPRFRKEHILHRMQTMGISIWKHRDQSQYFIDNNEAIVITRHLHSRLFCLFDRLKSVPSGNKKIFGYPSTCFK